MVKVNVPELLRAELARPSWKRELVALGTNTDPYQWVESRYRMMPEILEALEAAQTPVSVLTKSPLVMRDVEDLRADGEEAAGLGQPLGPDPRRGRLAGDRAAHAQPRRPPRRRRRAAPPRHRLRRPHRPPDARHQRPPRPGPPDRRTRHERPAPPSSAASPSTSATRSKTSSSPGWRKNAPTSSPATRPSTAGRAYMRPEQRKQTTRAVRGWGRNRLRKSLRPLRGPLSSK